MKLLWKYDILKQKVEYINFMGGIMASKNKNQIQFKKLKKNHVGFVIFLYVLIIFMMAAMVVFSFIQMITSSFGTKLMSEYESFYDLVRIYEKGREEDPAGILELLGASERDFMILDAEGKTLYQNGEDTMIRESALLSLNAEDVVAFEDQQQTELLSRVGDYWGVNYKVIIKDIWKKWKEILYTEEPLIGIHVDEGEELDEEETGWKTSVFKRQYDDEEGEDEDGKSDGEDWDEAYLAEDIAMNKLFEEWNEKLNVYPMWFALPLQNGKEMLVGKVNYSINLEDAVILLAMGLVMAVLAVIVLILMIVSMIRGVLRQKKIVNLYLTDPVTDGHNWNWFLLRGEPYLRLMRNANKNFAVIEIVFVNYRNFCVCHSVEEGEKILYKIYGAISRSLGKKGMCAHAATSSFAVLERYGDEDELRNQMRELLENLENVDSTHKFAFHIGVNLLPVQQNKNNKPMRRRNMSLEAEYNNACTARMTLEESDDSRIAFFDEKMVEEQKWLDAVTERQQGAVEKEEFKVYYQPKYDPRTGKLCGAEALIRWDSPDLGFVSPGRFIPLFEKNGFITEIDHYMINHVARDQKAWLDQGLTCVPVSVNVSRAHFIEKDLADQICRMVDDAGTPHHLIEIELTESAFFDDKNAMISTILKLKEAGFAVSMDDFGSGYSSLNSLKDMPLDVLKLDAEFFRGENAGVRGEIVVSEAIKLARSLNMRTVAEGVEEKEQVEFLAEKGCDMIQGYYFAKPMPKGDYEERMRSGYSEKEVKGEPENEKKAEELRPMPEDTDQSSED